MRRLACAMFVGALVLGGCGGEDPPAPVPTPVATTPANPGVTLPPMPPGATEDSHGGASTFVRYYLAVLSYATESGETAELERLSATECSACISFINATRRVYDAGGSISGGQRTFSDAKVSYLGPDAESLITADVAIAAATRRDSASATPKVTSAATMRLTFGVIGHGDTRQVSAISQGDPR